MRIFDKFRHLPVAALLALAQCGGKMEGPEPEPIQDEPEATPAAPLLAEPPPRRATLEPRPPAPELRPCPGTEDAKLVGTPGPPPPPMPPPVPDPPRAPVPGGQMSCGAGKCG